MRTKSLLLLLLACSCVASDASAQGTKDPSNPVPTMVTPIRPRNGPAGSTAVPNSSAYYSPYSPYSPYGTYVPRLRRIHPVNPNR
jgi:hypothetical protein